VRDPNVPYSLATLWHERNRYLPAVLAVAFSALLIALQCGLLLGLFSITSTPIDHTSADVWVGDPDVLSVDVGRPIPEAWSARLARLPGVEHVETLLEGFSFWTKPSGGTELVCVVGSCLEADSLGAMDALTPALRVLLTEPGACVIDESELDRLGVKGVGDTAEVAGHRVRVVGLVRGVRSLVGPYVFCSLSTARPLLRGYADDQTTYLLGKCRSPADAAAVVDRLRPYTDMSAYTSRGFSLRTRMHWLTRTKAGIALGCAAALGLLVGAAVTRQTLYAAVIAALREFAVLRALGIPRWRMVATVLAQAFWVGIVGVGLALPAVFGFAWLADGLGAKVLLPSWLLATAALLTLTMAFLSGLAALRSLRHAEPAALLR
jgi:putative ABC transport system permease protein